jgi:hypothetical protein
MNKPPDELWESETVRALRVELETSRESRRRAWEVLQELRKILTDLGNREDPAAQRKMLPSGGGSVEADVASLLTGT